MEKKDPRMKQSEYINSIETEPKPLAGSSLELQALWWVRKGDWGKAHDLAQDAGSPLGDWIHAHLHRMEGDLGNAAYWYSRAGKAVRQGDLAKEWEDLVGQVIKE